MNLSDYYPAHLTPGGPALLRDVLTHCPAELLAREDARFLLVGCRYGEHALALAQHVAGSVIGVDEDAEAILYGKMAATSLGLAGKVSLQFMSPVSLALRPPGFDVVILEGVLSAHVPTRALKEALRMLAPDGYLLLADSCWLHDEVPTYVRDVWEARDHKLLHREALLRLLEERGLRVVHVDDRSRALDAFYRQFQDAAYSLAKGGFEGMKHMKHLVKHYKHEIDVYRKHGGDRFMGYLAVLAKRGTDETA